MYKILLLLLFTFMYGSIHVSSTSTCNSINHDVLGCNSNGYCQATDFCICFVGWYGKYCSQKYRDLKPWVIGQNERGQAGFALSDPIGTFAKLNSPLDEVRIGLQSGLKSQFLVFDDKIYASGQGTYLGIGNPTTSGIFPHEQVDLGKKIRYISSSVYTVVITEDNELYTWGQLTLFGDTLGPIEDTPVLVTTNHISSQIVSVKSSRYHTLILTLAGKVYSRGENRGADSQGLGIAVPNYEAESLHREETFVEVTALSDPIKLISSSLTGGCAVATDNKLYCWGSNARGALGINNNDNDYFHLTPLESDLSNVGASSIADICGGGIFVDSFRNTHYLLRTENGKVYGWGSGSNSRLGMGGSNNIFLPTEIGASQFLAPIERITCGQQSNFAVDRLGNLYIWGSFLQTYSIPTRLNIDNIDELYDLVDLDMGFDTAAIVTKLKPFCDGIISTNPNVCSSFGNCTDHDVCQCETNYFGKYCDVTFCFGKISNGTERCTSTSRGQCTAFNTCTCNTGFTGPECEHFVCNGISSASPSVCSGSGNCTNVDTCQCESNFYDTFCDNWNCKGISRKSGDVCSSNGNCIQPDRCSCDTNYVGDDCEIPICFGILANSSSVCTYRNGTCVAANTCDCFQGYGGSQCQYYDCFGILSNEPNVCNGHGKCHNPNECSCALGFDGDECEITLECFGVSGTEVCSGHGACVETDVCSCESDYFEKDCSVTKCFGLFSNETNVCNGHGTCSSLENCDCDEKWFGDECNITSCNFIPETNETVCSGRGECVALDVCDCIDPAITNYTGQFCHIPICYGIPGNEDNVCTSHGTCELPNSCDCGLGYFGSLCQGIVQPQCYEFSHLDEKVCGGHGSCESRDSCQCQSDYYGANCDVFTCFGIGNPDPSVCGGHGRCTDIDECTCEKGYYGDFCEISTCNGILSNSTEVCSGNGFCVDSSCVCLPGYSGNCNQNVPANILCFGDSGNQACNGHGDCVEPNRCSCAEGYFGPKCEYFTCNNVLNTDQRVCNGHGVCSSTDQCSCENGYSGPSCELFSCFGSSSNDANVCNQHGTCIGRDSCECDTGFFGHLCNVPGNCPECPPNSACLDGNSCTCHNSSENGFWQGDDCSECREGYFGDDCRFSFSSKWTLNADGSGLEGNLSPKRNQIPCKELFLNAESLGNNPRCYWQGDLFKVDFGQNPSLKAQDQLILRLDVSNVKRTVPNSFAIDIEGEVTASKPIAVIGSSLETSLCADEFFVLDGSSSYSRDRRSLTYIWNCENGDSQISSINSFVHGRNHSVLRIPNNLLTNNIPYFFSLQVRNQFGIMSDKSFTSVRRSSSSIPVASIVSSPILTVPHSESLRLRGRLSQLECLDDAKDIRYSWTQERGPTISVDEKDQPILFLHQGVMPPVEIFYSFRFTALRNGIRSSSILKLGTKVRPLQAVIAGGSRIVIPDNNGIFTLDGSKSFDPEQGEEVSMYSWMCFAQPTMGGCPSGFNSATKSGPVISLPASDFPPGKYVFELTYFKKSRFSTASVVLEFVSDHQSHPMVTIQESPPYFDYNSELPIIAAVSRKQGIIWSADELSSDVTSTNLNSRSLVIDPNSLLPGKEYEFTIQLTGDTSSYASTKVRSIYLDPGLLEVYPTEGISGETEFFITAVQWPDHQHEFEFSCRELLTGNEIILQSSPQSFVVSRIPFVGQVEIRLNVVNTVTKALYSLSTNITTERNNFDVVSFLNNRINVISKHKDAQDHNGVMKDLATTIHYLQLSSGTPINTKCFEDCSDAGDCSQISGRCQCNRDRFGDDCRFESRNDFELFSEFRKSLFEQLFEFSFFGREIDEVLIALQGLMLRPSEVSFLPDVVSYTQDLIRQAHEFPRERLTRIIHLLSSLLSVQGDSSDYGTIAGMVKNVTNQLTRFKYPGQNVTTLPSNTLTISLLREDGEHWKNKVIFGETALSQRFEVQFSEEPISSKYDAEMVGLALQTYDINPFPHNDIGGQVVIVSMTEGLEELEVSSEITLSINKNTYRLLNEMDVAGDCQLWTGTRWTANGCSRIGGTNTTTTCICEQATGVFSVKYTIFIFPAWGIALLVLFALCIICLCCLILCVCILALFLRLCYLPRLRKSRKVVPNKDPLGYLGSTNGSDSWSHRSDLSYLGIYEHHSDDDELFMNRVHKEGHGINVDEDGIGDDTIRNLVLLFQGKIDKNE